jgi:hypothetical protein
MIESRLREQGAAQIPHEFSALRRWLGSAAGLTVAAAFAISRAALLFWYAPHPTDIRIYFGWIVQAAAGRIPYADFPVEYPPFAWWVMLLPGTADRLAYYFRFRVLMAAADIFSFALLVWIVSRRRPSLLTSFACVYIGTTLILAHELYDRLDMGVLLFAAVALAAWLAARPGADVPRSSIQGPAQSIVSSTDHERPGVREARSPKAGWWLAGAYAAAGLGTGYKLFPAVVVPLFLVSELLTRARLRSVILRLVLFVCVAAGPVALTYWRIGGPAVSFLGYHGARGLEIGSTWASAMWLLSLAGQPAIVVIRFGSWELAGAAEAAFSRAASLSMILVPVLLTAWAVMLRGRFDAGRSYAQAALALAGVVIASKVFSPQFLLWAIPVIALAAVEVCATKRRFLAVGGGLLVSAALTLLIYEGGGSEELRIMRPWVMLALLTRNVMYVSLWLYLAGAFVRRDWNRTHPRP